jgi:small conductance mechanosensitive channel
MLLRMDFQTLWHDLSPTLVNYGLRVVGALVMWVIGRWAIAITMRIVRRALLARHVDATLQKYLVSIGGVALNVLLVVAILSQFGVETTSFAALMAAAGLAIGTAWGGLLANFAAGAFLLILRPFKVGDAISGAGVSGVVDEIGLFATTITTGDGVRTFVGNNKLFSDNIQNFTASNVRRVDRTMLLAHGVDVEDATARIRAAVQSIPNVLPDPAPEIFIMDFTPSGTLLAVRPFTRPEHVPAVGARTNDAIRRIAIEAGYPVPAVPQTMIPSP